MSFFLTEERWAGVVGRAVVGRVRLGDGSGMGSKKVKMAGLVRGEKEDKGSCNEQDLGRRDCVTGWSRKSLEEGTGFIVWGIYVYLDRKDFMQRKQAREVLLEKGSYGDE